MTAESTYSAITAFLTGGSDVDPLVLAGIGAPFQAARQKNELESKSSIAEIMIGTKKLGKSKKRESAKMETCAATKAAMEKKTRVRASAKALADKARSQELKNRNRVGLCIIRELAQKKEQERKTGSASST
jgi:hypothetical protein